MNNKFNSWILLILFLAAPYIQSDTASQFQADIARGIPPIVSTLASYARWIIFAIIIISTLFNTFRYRKYFTDFNRLIIGFYSIPLLYSIISLSDFYRYLGLFVGVISLPLFLTAELNKNKTIFNIKNINYIVIFSLILSILVNIKVIFAGLRFQGVSNNANLYGMTATFWMSLILINTKALKIPFINIITAIVIFVTIILSGSRGALVGALIVLVFTFIGDFKRSFLLIFILIIAIYTLQSKVDLSFIFSRFERISTSASDSGREDIWNNAFFYIKNNAFFGNGMKASTELLHAGNVHNCYVRFMLMMGIPFTIFTLIFYILLIVKLLKSPNIPRSLTGCITAFAFANFGEDFFVGVGSSIFIYLNIIIAFIALFHLKSHKLHPALK